METGLVQEIYRSKVATYGNSPKSDGYWVDDWAHFEKEQVLNSLKGRGGRLLDVGCGIGFISRELLTNFEVVGIDLSADHLGLCPRSNRFFSIQANALELPFQNGIFDVTLTCNLLQIFKPESGYKLLQEMVLRTKPGGEILILARNGPSMVRHLTYPIFKGIHFIRQIKETPLYGYQSARIEQEMKRWNCRLDRLKFLFSPFHLSFGHPWQILGTSFLMRFLKP